MPMHTNANKGMSAAQQNIDIGEIDFGSTTPISKLATGRSHVLALDARGRVWSWGTNDKGQLGYGVSDTANKETPQRVAKLSNICQIYCGEY